MRRAVRRGSLRQILHGVYLRADVCLTVSVKLAAVTLVVNAGAVACDRTAAWIWGVDVHELRELDGVPPVEVFVLSGHRRCEREAVLGGERALLPIDWVEVEGVKVTTPLRTAMDLGCRLNRRQALAAMDALMRAHGFTHHQMKLLLGRYRRRRGVVQLRELVPVVNPGAESQPESWTRLELLDHLLPAPQVQWWVVVDGVPTYRLDLAYPHAKVAIEYDGEEFHSSAEDRLHDLERREWLEAHGWTVIVVDRRDFSSSSNRFWISEVARALRESQRPPRRHYARI
jgi:very-short-patch-repair endonuclease